MQALAELDLPHLAMEEPGFGADPWPHFVAARQQHPWLASCKFGTVVSEYGAMKDLLWKDDSLHAAITDVVDIMDARDTPWGKFQVDQIIAYNGPGHKRLRDILASAFTPRQAQKHRPLMRAQIARLLDEWAPKGAFDFEEFASYFPISVMCRLIGAPPPIIPDLKSSMEALGLSMAMDPALMPALQQAAITMYDSIGQVVADRRAGERQGEEEDMLDILLATRAQGGMTEDELLSLLVMMFVAGYDTSKNALTMMMDVLIDRPDDYRRCADDPDFCARVVEENFRFHTSATIARRTIRDIEYREVLIPEGTMLFFPVSVAGRDPHVAADATEFNPEREQKHRHIAFGRGQHMCLGQHIARAQIEEGLHQITRRITHPRRAGPSGWRPFFGVWGMKGLPIEFDPA
jgi:cytochrome P450